MEKQTHTAEDLMAMVSQLPIVERVRFHKLFKDGPQNGVEIDEYLTEQRFSSGRVCPICGGTHVQRNGRRRNGTQKFICKDCGKTFSIRKNSIFSGTRKPMSVWHESMDCMAEGLTLDESAERCGISHKTAFTWRHKILDAMSKYLNNYLVWNNAVEHKGGSLREKATNILNFATSALFEETCLAVPMRPPSPILVKNQS